MNSNNGVAPTTVESVVEQLREALGAEEAILVEAEAVAQQQRNKLKGMRRALAALDGGRPRQRRSPTPLTRKDGTPKTVSDSMVERTWDVVMKLKKPTPVKAIAEQVGATREPVATALEVLRQRGMVRMAGVEHSGPGRVPAQTYAPMPERVQNG